MNKEVIILIFATCVLGYLNVSFEYQNWTQPELDTSSINRATPDLNRIDVEGVKLFSLYSNYYSSITGDSEMRVSETQINSIELDKLVRNIEKAPAAEESPVAEKEPAAEEAAPEAAAEETPATEEAVPEATTVYTPFCDAVD